MKMRFDIEYTINKSDGFGVFIERSLLMKYMSYVVMNGVKYDKPVGNSTEVQSFYYFISNNKMKVTEIMMQNGCHVFLKNRELHSYDTYCYNQPMFKIMYYAKNGRVLNPDETKFFERKLKMKRLKEKIR